MQRAYTLYGQPYRLELVEKDSLLLGVSTAAIHTSTILTDPRYRSGACFFCIVYTYFRIPEPRGRSFAELDYLFEHRISARKFASTEVDVFHSELSDKAVARAMEESKDLPVHLEGKA